MARQSNAQELHKVRLLAAGLNQNGGRLAKLADQSSEAWKLVKLELPQGKAGKS